MDTLSRMRAFVQVVEAGGFSAAARRAGKSKALLSKYVRELEDELGVRLLNRTTRKLSPTEIGQSYHRDAIDLLGRLDELHTTVRDSDSEARGLLRVSGPRTFGDGDLSRAIMDFLVATPRVELDLHLDDRFVDVVQEGFDAAVRITELADSSLVARKLADFRMVIVATPEVVGSHGRPAEPRALAAVPCIIDTNIRQRLSWPFGIGAERTAVAVQGRVSVDSPLAVRHAALAGLGFARVPHLLVEDDIAAGRLVTVLDAFELEGLGISVLYPHRRHLSPKVRAFVDYLAAWFERARR